MGLTIPNDPAAPVNPASFADQAEPDKVDFDIIRKAFEDDFVVEGVTNECEVTASGPPAQTVDVAAGEIQSGGTPRTVAVQANFAMPAAHATLPRFDLVVIDSAGAKQYRQGTADANPCFPNLTAGDVCLAAVYRQATDNTIGSDDIIDKRMINRVTTGALYNVQDYGAAGDGVADDTTEIQAAIDAATANGGVVYFPTTSAYYRITADLVVKDDVVCKGDSMVSSIIRQETAGEHCLNFDPEARHLGVVDLRLESGVTAPSEAGDAIHADGNQVVLIQNVNINGAAPETQRWTHGLRIDDANVATTPCRWWIVQNLYIQAISGDSGSWAVRIDRQSGGWGFNFIGGIWQTEKHDDGTEYTTRGNGGLFIESVDGAHFSEIEIIAFSQPALMDASSGYSFITNTKFHSVSVESVAVDSNAAFQISGGGVITTVAWSGCTFYGATLVVGKSHGMLIAPTTGGQVHELSWVNCYFAGEDTGSWALAFKNVNNLAAYGPFVLTACHLNGVSGTGVLVDDDASRITLDACAFYSALTTAVDVDGGSDENKVLKLINCEADPAITTFIDDSDYTGGYKDISIEGNSPKVEMNFRPAVIEDHFMGGDALGTVWVYGDLHWQRRGSGTVARQSSENGYPGIYKVQTSSVAWVALSIGNGTQVGFHSGSDFHMVFIARPGSGETTSCAHLLGIISGTSPGDTPADGIFFLSTDSGTWRAIVRSSSTERSNTDTGVAKGAGTFKTFEIIKSGQTVYFYIDKAEEASYTHATLLPSAGVQPSFAAERTGASDRSIDADYFRLEMIGRNT